MEHVFRVKVLYVEPQRKRSYGYLVGKEAVIDFRSGVAYFEPMDDTAVADALREQRADPRRFAVGLPEEYFQGEIIGDVEVERGVE